MTVIEVNFLTGRFTATAHYDRTAHEWPPHGARLFSAMVATWADADPPDDKERAALEWLEAQPPPRISAPVAVPRRVVSYFVPVNDSRIVSASQYERRSATIAQLLAQFEDQVARDFGELTKKSEKLQRDIDKARDVTSLVGEAKKTPVGSAVALLPDDRGKKERHFPSLSLVGKEKLSDAGAGTGGQERATTETRVVFAWDAEPPIELREPLDSLLARVARLGHSSSLVSCRLLDVAPSATHLPGGGALEMRWVRRGQLNALEAEHQQHQGIRPRSLPFLGVQYQETNPAEVLPSQLLRPATAGDLVVFELHPKYRHLPMTRTVELSRVLRKAILSYTQDPPPAGVSGHMSDGQPSDMPHISFLALPNVGNEHADGRIMGLAVLLPDSLDEGARRATLRAIGNWERNRRTQGALLRLSMGTRGVVEMKRARAPFTLVSLRPETWEGSSRWWASAIPVALPAHPGDLRRGTSQARAKAWARAKDGVCASCVHVGLPHPESVSVSLVPHLKGVRPARDFPVFRQGSETRSVARRLVHVVIEFPEKVSGPLILGSGRFLGLGLMRPLDASVAKFSQGGADDD